MITCETEVKLAESARGIKNNKILPNVYSDAVFLFAIVYNSSLSDRMLTYK